MDTIDNKRLVTNRNIRAYWTEIRDTVNRDPISKKKVPRFTRHNGNRFLRLNKAWRYPKGTKGNKLTRPKIGFKNPEVIRYRKSNGLKLCRVFCKRDIEALQLKDYQVVNIAKSVGAKKRSELLEYCRDKGYPLYITR